MIAYIKLLLIPLLVFQSGLNFKQEDGKVSLYDGDDLIFSYQVETKSHQGQYPRANYIHPLNDFAGNSITEDFPEDHLHHRGIFWTWHQLYLNGQSLSDPWMCEGISWDVHDIEYHIDGKTATLRTTVDWLIGEDQQALVQEEVQIDYQNYGEYYRLDFTIGLESQIDHLELGGSDDNKGYGGFSARLALGDEVTFSAVSGEVAPDNEQVQAENWMLIDDIGENETQVAILYHQESTASLQGWILRDKGSMQNPVWPGRRRVELNHGDKVSIQASVVVFKDEADKEDVAKIYRKYLGI
jgi:hypothetical protein